MNLGYEPDDLKIYLFGESVDMRKQMNKDLSAMSRDELEQNIVELTTQVESQKQKIRWLQEQFNLLQQKRFGASSEKDMGSGEQMSLFNEAEWTADEAEGQISEPDMAKVAPPKKMKTKGGKLRMVSRLPKETIDFRLTAEEMVCPECGGELTEVRKTIRRDFSVLSMDICRRMDIRDTIPSQSGRRILP